MKTPKSHKPDLLGMLALGSVTLLGIGILVVVVFAPISENLKIAFGASSFATIVGGICTLLNVSRNSNNANAEVKGDQINVLPPEEGKEK